MTRTLGIIGGSGLYALDGLENIEEIHVETPFGPPSDALLRGELSGVTLYFLPRHGLGHRIAPHRINYRANIFALKQMGVEQVLSVSAVGSLKEEIAPGDMVMVDQFIDRTRTRQGTFFDDYGLVAHVGMGNPVDEALSTAVAKSVSSTDVKLHDGGTYLCMEGPQFSTRAESELYRSWGASVIGMTNMPEAKLAREAELPYASLAMATDYDCWHQTEEAVTVEAVIAVLQKNVAHARQVIAELVTHLPDPSLSPATHALRDALITSPEFISNTAKTELAPLLKKYV